MYFHISSRGGRVYKSLDGHFLLTEEDTKKTTTQNLLTDAVIIKKPAFRNINRGGPLRRSTSVNMAEPSRKLTWPKLDHNIYKKSKP
jgi:hypothetical protein